MPSCAGRSRQGQEARQSDLSSRDVHALIAAWHRRENDISWEMIQRSTAIGVGVEGRNAASASQLRLSIREAADSG